MNRAALAAAGLVAATAVVATLLLRRGLDAKTTEPPCAELARTVAVQRRTIAELRADLDDLRRELDRARATRDAVEAAEDAERRARADPTPRAGDHADDRDKRAAEHADDDRARTAAWADHLVKELGLTPKQRTSLEQLGGWAEAQRDALAERADRESLDDKRCETRSPPNGTNTKNA